MHIATFARLRGFALSMVLVLMNASCGEDVLRGFSIWG